MSYYDVIEAQIEALEARRRELLVFKQKYKVLRGNCDGWFFIGNNVYYEKLLDLEEEYCVDSYQDAKEEYIECGKEIKELKLLYNPKPHLFDGAF